MIMFIDFGRPCVATPTALDGLPKLITCEMLITINGLTYISSDSQKTGEVGGGYRIPHRGKGLRERVPHGGGGGN